MMRDEAFKALMIALLRSPCNAYYFGGTCTVRPVEVHVLRRLATCLHDGWTANPTQMSLKKLSTREDELSIKEQNSLLCSNP
jgi:hypothetical protein